MKKTIKGFVLGLIIATLLMSTVFGAGVKKTIEVAFNSINLTVNGNKVDADTILYQGTTYVPLRAVGEMLGKNVGWDGDTNTASINDKDTNKPIDKKITKNVGKIGTPGVYNGVGADGNLYPYVGFKFDVNSANGITLDWIAQNLTGKTINYYTVNITMYNAVGDLSYDSITKKATKSINYVGPVSPNNPLLVSGNVMAYSGSCSKIVIDSIDLIYSDDTKETISYGHATTQRTWD